MSNDKLYLDTIIYRPTFDNDINKVKGSTQGVDVADGAGVDKRIHFIEVDTEINHSNINIIYRHNVKISLQWMSLLSAENKQTNKHQR